MKTNKILVAVLATAMALSLGATSMYASGGNGQGGGQGMGKNLTQEQREELQSMSMEEKQAYMKANGLEKGKGKDGKGGGHEKGGDHNPGDMIADIAPQNVSAVEIDLLEKQYEEEMMANELYNSFYEMYGIETFKNIATSEAKHMEAVQALLDRYNIDTPSSYDHIQSLYDDLKTKGALSLQDALEVGVSIEKVDIDDIITAIKSSDNDDIRTVLVNIGGASYNHMRGFVKALDNNDLTTDIDYSDYLNSDDINTKGPIKVKLALKLEAEGVELPEGATSKAITEKCDKEGKGGGHDKGEKNMNKGDNGKKYAGTNTRGVSESLKNRYKDAIVTKYQSSIDALSEDKLNAVLVNIDVFEEKISTSTEYSEFTKKKYMAVLDILKDMILEKLGEVGLDIDSIFN